jgi:hypothetical protein
MPSRRVTGEEPKPRKRPPATTPEGRENQLIVQAIDLAEKQIRAGTVSAQVLGHYVKLGSSRERLEQERLRRENLLLEAKADQIASAARVEDLYKTALDAMRAYSGQDMQPLDDEYEE